MDFSKATFQQLLHIAYHENCPIDFKYKAMFELKQRREKEASRAVSRYKNKAAFTDKSYRITR